MEKIILKAKIRKEIGKNSLGKLRREGFIPAVIYGAGIENLNIKLLRSEFLKFIHEHRIETTVFNLLIEDSLDKSKKEYTCMIKEIQYHPLSDEILHVDFNHISLTKLIKVKVPVIPKGEPLGVKQEGGALERLLWEIEVECLPTNIPEKIEVDVSNLKLNDSLQIKDIPPLGEGIKILTSSDTVVFTVSPPIKEEVVTEEVVAGEEKLEPEVIREKKETQEEKKEENKE